MGASPTAQPLLSYDWSVVSKQASGLSDSCLKISEKRDAMKAGGGRGGAMLVEGNSSTLLEDKACRGRKVHRKVQERGEALVRNLRWFCTIYTVCHQIGSCKYIVSNS